MSSRRALGVDIWSQTVAHWASPAWIRFASAARRIFASTNRTIAMKLNNLKHRPAMCHYLVKIVPSRRVSWARRLLRISITVRYAVVIGGSLSEYGNQKPNPKTD